jgi:iron transport multicopper oxidase
MQLIPSVLAAIVLDAALAAQVKMNLPIVNKVIAPDGYSRSATLAGGTFPGPLIQGDPVSLPALSISASVTECTQTSTFQINVQNLLHDKSMHLATTIHWHGLHQKNTSWADGAAFVSQCPIVPSRAALSVP